MGSQRAILLLLIAIQVYYESVLAKSVHHSDDAYPDNEKAYLTRSQSNVPSKNLKVKRTLSDHSVGHVGTNAIMKKSAVRRAFNLPPISPFPEEPYRRSFINRSPDYINKQDKKIQHEDNHAAKDDGEEDFIIRVPKCLPSDDFEDDARSAKDKEPPYTDMEQHYKNEKSKCPSSDDFEDDVRAAKDDGEESFIYIIRVPKCLSSDDFEDDYIIGGK